MIEIWRIEELTGYKVCSSFYLDFSIAERFGVNVIKRTYTLSFDKWKSNCQYITELCMVLNWKMFRWHNINEEYYQLYKQLYLELDQWCIDNLKGDDLKYYYETTD